MRAKDLCSGVPVAHRRAIAVASASGDAAAGMPTFSSGDANLLRLCETCLAIDRQVVAIVRQYANVVRAPDDVKRKQNCLSDRLVIATERVVFTPATSLAGLRAKAAVLARFAYTDLDGDGPEAGDPCERLAWSLAHDLIAPAT